MIPEIFVLVSTVCFQALGGTLVLHHAMSVERGFIGELSCFESVQISTGPVVAKEGQTVKRLCDFVGHRWQSIFHTTPDGEVYLSDDLDEDLQRCAICLKKRRRITSKIERWEDVP